MTRAVTPEMDIDACYSPDYATARARFVTCCETHGGTARSYANPNQGPAGETLATDTAWFGPVEAQRVLVLVSGTRGIDGFSGAAAQLDWMDNGGPGALPADVAVLLIHAINPHGFAWLRRVTEEGADLNRNWIDFNRPLPENPGYDALADAILPGALDGPGLASAQTKLAAWRDKHGEHAFRAILDDGQFKHPFGPYYGGAAPTWARRTLETIIEENRLALRDLVAVIDFHTGRGPYGSGEPICGHRPDTAGRRLTRQWYGDSLTAPCADRTADPRVGLSQYGWLYELGDRVAFISLEFGTYDFETTFKALQADHWLHARGDVTWDCPKTRDIKTPLQRAYYPDRTDWRELVLFRSRQAIGQALAGLADEAG